MSVDPATQSRSSSEPRGERYTRCPVSQIGVRPLRHVDESPVDRRHRHRIAHRSLVILEWSKMNGDARSTSAKSPRHGEVDGRGHGVADAVDDEGGLVADNGIGTCPETSHHEILEALGGKRVSR